MEFIKELGPILGLSTIIGSILAASWSWLTREWTGDIERAYDKYVNIDRLAGNLEKVHPDIQNETSSDLTGTANKMRAEALTSLLRRSGTPNKTLHRAALLLLVTGLPTLLLSFALLSTKEETIPPANMIFAVSGLLALIVALLLFMISEIQVHRRASLAAWKIIAQLPNRVTCKACGQPTTPRQGVDEGANA